MEPKVLKCFFYEFGVGKPCSALYYLEVDARALLKLATKEFLEGKNSLKIEFFRSLL